MKKTILVIFIIVFLLSGCSWMDSSYTYVTPHVELNAAQQEDNIYIDSYKSLRNYINDMISDGDESNLYYFTDNYSSKNFEKDFDDLNDYFCNTHPLGSFAVSFISYELGTRSGQDAVMISISYRHTRAEIITIPQVNTMDDVESAILRSLENCESGLVIMVNNYRDFDVDQLIEDYAMEYPDKIMEIPTATASVYSNSGLKRLIEITYQYQTSREVLRTMKDSVSQIFQSAKLYVSNDATEHEKYMQLYTFLSNRHDYRLETSITSSYSLLRYGVGDSRAFAIVFAEMCEKVGLSCLVVSGTKDGVAHFWNIVCDEDHFFHVDLIQCIQDGEFTEKTDVQMNNYVWNYSAYPECLEIVQSDPNP